MKPEQRPLSSSQTHTNSARSESRAATRVFCVHQIAAVACLHHGAAASSYWHPCCRQRERCTPGRHPSWSRDMLPPLVDLVRNCGKRGPNDRAKEHAPPHEINALYMFNHDYIRMRNSIHDTRRNAECEQRPLIAGRGGAGGEEGSSAESRSSPRTRMTGKARSDMRVLLGQGLFCAASMRFCRAHLKPARRPRWLGSWVAAFFWKEAQSNAPRPPRQHCCPAAADALVEQCACATWNMSAVRSRAALPGRSRACAPLGAGVLRARQQRAERVARSCCSY